MTTEVGDGGSGPDIPDPAAFLCMRGRTLALMCNWPLPCAHNDSYEACLASAATHRPEWLRAEAECVFPSPLVCMLEPDASATEAQCEFDALVRLGPSDAAIAAATALCTACPGSAWISPPDDGGLRRATNFAECMEGYFPPDRRGFAVPGLTLLEASDRVNEQIRTQCVSSRSGCEAEIPGCVQQDFADVIQPCIDASTE